MSLIARAVQQSLKQRGLQTKAYRALSTAPGASGVNDDIVVDTFIEQQKAIRSVLEGMKKVHVPLDLDPAAVKKYASEVEALKKKAGIPEMEDIFSATLNQDLLVAKGKLRKFLQSATANVDLKPYTEVVTKLFAALDKTEAAHGPVNASNAAAMKAFEKEANNKPIFPNQVTHTALCMQDIFNQHKIGDVKNIKQQAIVDMYMEQLKEARSSTEEEIKIIQRRDGLEGIDVDVATLKPSLA